MCTCSVVSDSLYTLWTIACQAPLSVGFFSQEYWSGLPFPPPGDLPDPGIKCVSPASPALAGGFLTTEPPVKSLFHLKFENFMGKENIFLGKKIWEWRHPWESRQCNH